METIKEVKIYLFDNLYEGCICPCCHQTVKAYKRRIYNKMAHYLIELYKLTNLHPETEYFHVNVIGGRMIAGDFAKLRYWNLIAEKSIEKENVRGRTSGYWKITSLGKEFVERKVKLPSHVYIYNDRFIKKEGTSIDIVAALGKNFDYNKLMNNEL